MKIQTFEYNGRSFKYMASADRMILLFNTKEICDFLCIKKENRDGYLSLPFCDKAAVILCSANINTRFTEHIISKFDGYSGETRIHPNGYDENWNNA